MKKFISLLLSVVLLGSMSVFAVYEPEFEPAAESILLINLDSGRVVYEKNADTKRPPASLVKIMTSMLLLEQTPDLDAETVVAPRYIYDEFVGINVSTADIKQGEEITPRQLLYAMLLQSANEAASIVADYLSGGDIPAFVDTMNARAQELGCTNTNFTNPHGLHHEQQYSTARDLALIAMQAIETPGFMEAASTSRYTIPANNMHASERILVSTISMMDEYSVYYKDYVSGIKTGTLPEAGHNFISTASQNGENYLLVVMGASYEGENAAGEPLSAKPAFDITADIYNWVYNNFSVKAIMEGGKPVEQIPVKWCAESDTLLLELTDSIYSLVPNEEDVDSIQRIYEIPEFVEAPVKEGDVIGSVVVMQGEEVLGRAELLAAESLQRSNMLYYMDVVIAFFSSSTFIAIMAVIGLLIVLYIALYIRALQRHRRRMTRKKQKR